MLNLHSGINGVSVAIVRKDVIGSFNKSLLIDFPDYPIREYHNSVI